MLRRSWISVSCFATVVNHHRQDIFIISRSSTSGASGQASGQWLTYFTRLPWRNDTSSPTWVDGKEEVLDEGPQPIPSLHLHHCLLHILLRVQTASHAEANVKINNYDLSWSAHSDSQCQAIFFFLFSEGRNLLAHWTPLTSPISCKMSSSLPPHQCFPWHSRTRQGLYGATCGVRARKRLMLMSRVDNEVCTWQDLCGNHSGQRELRG